MKKLISLAVIILILFSCKKDNDSNLEPEANTPLIDTQIKTYINAQGDTLLTKIKYNYNPKGYITEMYYTSTHEVYVHKFEYVNTSLILRILSSGTYIDTTFFLLNSKGLIADYYVRPYKYPKPIPYLNYKYDRNNYKIEETHYRLKSPTDYSRIERIYSYIVVDGNTTTDNLIFYHNDGPNYEERRDHTFYKENINTIGNSNKGMSFFGASDANPIKEKTGNSGTKILYTYEYDSKNRIVRQIIDENNYTTFSYK